MTAKIRFKFIKRKETPCFQKLEFKILINNKVTMIWTQLRG